MLHPVLKRNGRYTFKTFATGNRTLLKDLHDTSIYAGSKFRYLRQRVELNSMNLCGKRLLMSKHY